LRRIAAGGRESRGAATGAWEPADMEQARADRIFKVRPTSASRREAHAGSISQKENVMNRMILCIGACAAALSIGACSDMNHRDRDTVAGAAIGGVAGSALTGGSTAGTVGGAVVGGVVGNQYGRDH
jgi:osmotically inducible lipoprotein OsmB